MEKDKKCPYCAGTGQILIPDKRETTLDKYGKPIEDYCYYTCFCINNKVVSKTFNKLAGIPNITPEETIAAGKFAGFRNLLIHGNEQKFLHLVKATMVLHANYNHTFEFLNGVELVQKYYVEQAQEVQRTLGDLENKNLVIFIFDASTENKVQNKVVFEVLKNRFRMNDPTGLYKKTRIARPTWVYSHSLEAFKMSKEYSADIEPFIEHFVPLDMAPYKVPFEVNNTSKYVNDSFAGSDINDMLGK